MHTKLHAIELNNALADVYVVRILCDALHALMKPFKRIAPVPPHGAHAQCVHRGMRCEVVFGFIEVAVLLNVLECLLRPVDQHIHVDDLRCVTKRVTKRVTRWVTKRVTER